MNTISLSLSLLPSFIFTRSLAIIQPRGVGMPYTLRLEFEISDMLGNVSDFA